jgi:hypothetical protein
MREKNDMILPFNQFVSALACAVVDAQHQVRQSHISELYNHFKDGSPVSVELQIPRVSQETGLQTPIKVTVPLITLINPSQLSIQEMLITMQVDMNEITKDVLMEDNSKELKEKTSTQPYEWKSSGYQTLISTSTTTGKKPGEVGMAQVTLKVKAEEVPEGLARLLDHLNKCL